VATQNPAAGQDTEVAVIPIGATDQPRPVSTAARPAESAATQNPGAPHDTAVNAWPGSTGVAAPQDVPL